MSNFDAYNEFITALEEIDILIKSAEESEENILKYKIYNKASIVLLCGKLEAFLESFIEEYFYIITSNYTNNQYNDDIKYHLTEVLLKEVENKPNQEKKFLLFKQLARLHGETDVKCSELRPDCKFNYGKHGEGEVKKLLKKAGLSSICEIEDTKIFFTKFNSLNNLRNNILHQDATPTLTLSDVKEHKKVIEDFVNNLCEYANNNIKRA